MLVYWTLVQYEKNRDFKQKSESNKVESWVSREKSAPSMS